MCDTSGKLIMGMYPSYVVHTYLVQCILCRCTLRLPLFHGTWPIHTIKQKSSLTVPVIKDIRKLEGTEMNICIEISYGF